MLSWFKQSPSRSFAAEFDYIVDRKERLSNYLVKYFKRFYMWTHAVLKYIHNFLKILHILFNKACKVQMGVQLYYTLIHVYNLAYPYKNSVILKLYVQAYKYRIYKYSVA